MGKCCGNPGRCTPRWIVGIWMLWIMIPLVEASVDSCPDASGEDIPCPLNELVGVNCTYMKGLPAQIPELALGNTDFSRCVKELTVQPYLKNGYRTENSIMYLNITWKIDAFACRNLSGFILNATFMYEGIQRYIYRTYSLSVEDWNDQNIFETAFRHECIIPSMNNLYRIEVHSLPRSTNDSKSVAAIYYKQNAVALGYPYNTVSTYSWIASMWMTRNSPEDGLSSVNVCFYFAPTSFGFKDYKMTLMRLNTSVLQLTLQEALVYDNGTQKRHECVTFENVCPGIYKVFLLPLAEVGSCTCRAAPNDCRDSCTATVFEPIDMTESVCNSPSPPSTTTTPPQTSERPPTAPDAATDSNRSITTGIVTAKNVEIVTAENVGIVEAENVGIVETNTFSGVVVITSAVVVVIVVIIIIFVLFCKRRAKVSFRSSAVVPFLTLEKQPPT